MLIDTKAYILRSLIDDLLFFVIFFSAPMMELRTNCSI